MHGLTIFRLRHGTLTGLSDNDHPHYLRVNGNQTLSDTWDAVEQIRSSRFHADGGGAPFVVSSEAEVTNLNVEELDGNNLAHYRNAGNYPDGNLTTLRMPSGSDTWSVGTLTFGGILSVTGDASILGELTFDGPFVVTGDASFIVG